MLQLREMRLPYTNGLVLLRICAPLEGALAVKTHFVGSNASFSLMFLYT